ncbi:MAG: hypothetical protein LBL86_10115 [Coriobacteriales bacterium]|jgi:anaerobic selenocysteine-containing dehydrogenase|nr:hypothetical protein [Coriobacteriales bacterium]
MPCAPSTSSSTSTSGTPPTDAADIILPVAHWIELNSPRASQGSAGAMGATVKCVQPPAEATYDPEIVMALFERMGVPWTNEPGNEWPDIEWQLADAIKLISDDELTYSTWQVEDGRPTVTRHGTRFDEVTPKYRTWDEYIAAFQEHGWWQAKEIQKFGFPPTASRPTSSQATAPSRSGALSCAPSWRCPAPSPQSGRSGLPASPGQRGLPAAVSPALPRQPASPGHPALPTFPVP